LLPFLHTFHSEHLIDAPGEPHQSFRVCSGIPVSLKVIIEGRAQLPNNLSGNFFGVGSE